MPEPLNVLVMGASYGSLLATKFLLAGHSVTLACLPAEAELINREGTRVRLPVKGREAPVELDSRQLSGKLSAAVPDAIFPAQYDLAVLAMQEPQYASPAVRELLAATAQAQLPCLSIMNMPPLPYLKRIPSIPADEVRDCYTDASVWDHLDPELVTLCSPDPQAMRPRGEPNVLVVKLPTNFKAARFASVEHNSMLHRLAADIDASRHQGMELPVKLRVHDSVFVPLAKWSMLIAGNYRCITRQGMRSIRDTVHGDPEASRRAYEWVAELCRALGAHPEDLVPFEKYAAAAQGLTGPSSAARALFGGARNIERVDRLVQVIAARHGMRSPILDEIVELVDARLAANRRAA